MNHRGIELVENKGKYYFEDPTLERERPTPMPERGTRQYRAWVRHERDDTARQRQAWMDSVGAVHSEAVRCLCKVAGGRRSKCGLWGGYSRKPLCEVSSKQGHSWFDHAELFWLPATQEYVLTGQPYDVSMGKVREMEDVARKHGLELTISMTDAWHNPGRCPLLVWRRAQPREDR